MADEEQQQESTEEQPESTESPTPSTPSLVSPEQASAPPFDADQFMEKLSGVIDEKITRTFQSAKDRRFANLERLSAALKASGGDTEKARKDLMLEDIYEQQMASEQAAGPAQAGNENAEAKMQARTAQLLQGAGIDFEDPDYMMLNAQYGGRITNPDDWIDVVQGFVDMRKDKQDKQESIPDAAAASEGGKVITVEGDEDIESLAQELAKLQALPANAETMAKRKEIRQKLGVLQGNAGLYDNIQIT